MSSQSSPVLSPSASSYNRLWYFLLFGALFTCFWNLGLLDITDVNEAQRTVPTREMIETGDWVVPRIEGRPYINKPPLVYWIMAPFFMALGQHPGVARIPMATGCVLAALLVAWIGRRHGRPREGIWAGFVLTSGGFFQHYAQFAELDTIMMTVLGATVYVFYLSLRRESPRWFAAAALAGVGGGLAFMLKGPVFVPFLLAAAVAAWILERPPLKRVFLASAIVLAIAIIISVPWCYLLVKRLSWDSVWARFEEQSLERLAKASRINSGPVWFYLENISAAFLPWTVLLLCWLARPFRVFERASNDDTVFRFAGLYAVIALVFFSLMAGKETEYLFPIFPFLALACGPVVEWMLRGTGEGQGGGGEGRLWWWIPRLLAAVALLSPLVLCTNLRGWIFAHWNLAGMLFLGAALGGAALWYSFRGERLERSMLLLIAAMCLMVVMFNDALGLRLESKRSPRGAAALMHKFKAGGAPVFRFDLRQCENVWHMRDVPLLSQLPGGGKSALFENANPAYVVMEKKGLEDFKKQFGALVSAEEVQGEYARKYLVVKVARIPGATLPPETGKKPVPNPSSGVIKGSGE